MSIEALPSPGEILLYETEDGRTRVECRLVADTLWLPQAGMAELFQSGKQNIEKSFLVTRQAKQRATQLLEAAKRAVEIAIEDTEAAALAYLEGIAP